MLLSVCVCVLFVRGGLARMYFLYNYLTSVVNI